MIEINFTDGWLGWYYWPENEPPPCEDIIGLCKNGEGYYLQTFYTDGEDENYKEMLKAGVIAWTHNEDLTHTVLNLLLIQNKPLQ